ncbi:hypothetical protein SADUNF_Sadunf07G0056500 [Salix dunnii]|uniref:Uncharacterized protein n=1 Tax=Salix dunnii TaxID=1413687 RepID=A0A835JVV0_9ROSI|nr:hypothetical protein SADUNF_Sadunf07G0056500 [Salix dunnii]
MEVSNSTIPTKTNLTFAATHSKPAASKRNKGPGFTNPSHSPISYAPPPAHMGSFPNKPNASHSGDNRPTFNFSYQGRLPPSDLAAMDAEGNTSHTQQMWYADSRVNAHITNNTANLTTSQPYDGDDTITVGNGSDLVLSTVVTETEPSTYTQAVSSPQWCAAMGFEFDALMACRDSNGLHLHQTRFITDLLHSTNMVGAKPLNCPTVFSPKLSSSSDNINHNQDDSDKCEP